MESFDYVIVGAGAAGCVLANRLGQEPGVSICVLEAGGRDSHPYIRIPAGFVKTLYGDRLTWSFMTAPGDGIAGRQIRMPQGKVLGGSSSVNGMVYMRGAPQDRWSGCADTWKRRTPARCCRTSRTLRGRIRARSWAPRSLRVSRWGASCAPPSRVTTGRSAAPTRRRHRGPQPIV